jgi:hypothetical protein
MEEIQFDPLLVQAQQDRLVVKIRLHAIDRLGAIGAQSARWLVGNGLLVVQRAIRVVD